MLRLSALVVLAACAGRAFAPADRDAIAALLRDQAAAWNRGDLEGYMTGYVRSPDLVFTSGGNIRRGWEETLEKYSARYGSRPETMGRLALEILDLRPLGADGAVVLGRWKLTETAQAGSGVFTLALSRLPEGWRIVHDHTSSD